MTKLNMQPVTFEEALDLVLRQAEAVTRPPEYINLGKAVNRTLAEDIFADIDIPGADSSSMDGYCLKSTDIIGATREKPVKLPVVPGIDAGHTIASLPMGHCAYIATGAILPPGADAVVRIEDTEVSEDTSRIDFFVDVVKGNYIRPRGSELKRGDLMVKAPAVITPQIAGQIASAGQQSVKVLKKPTVAILTSGDEVLMPFDQPQPWQVRNSNSTILSLQAKEAGAEVIDLGIARDRGEHARNMFLKAVEIADIVVTSGGISMGRRDPIKNVLIELGIEAIFYGVRMKPGKPVFFGAHNGKTIFALPGNQVSTSVTFELFVRPFIRKILQAPPQRLTLELALTRASDNKEGRDFFKRGRPVYSEGQLMIEPLASQESHMLSSLAGADLLFLHPANAGLLPAGSKVKCLYLKG